MKYAAKIILSDPEGNYLMLFRSNHPTFPYDPDLPGGTLKKGESPMSGLLREVAEETGMKLDINIIEKVYSSSKYNPDFTYYLYRAEFETKPEITISWEHNNYEWLPYERFVSTIKTAVDSYMHMVYDYLTGDGSKPARHK